MPQPKRKSAQGPTIHQLKVTLKRSDPAIWRRLQVPSDITLAELHNILQVAVGWENDHLHEFRVGAHTYGDPKFLESLEGRSEFETRLNQIAPRTRGRFIYEYDFGDSWEHDIRVEAVTPPEPGVHYPRCVAGERAGPWEDCGGIVRYNWMVATLNDPDSPDYAELKEWLDEWLDEEPIDLAAFDINEINERLGRVH